MYIIGKFKIIFSRMTPQHRLHSQSILINYGDMVLWVEISLHSLSLQPSSKKKSGATTVSKLLKIVFALKKLNAQNFSNVSAFRN